MGKKEVGCQISCLNLVLFFGNSIMMGLFMISSSIL